MKKFGLKTKITLMLAIVLFVVFPMVSIIAEHYMKQELISWVTTHQKQEVLRISEGIDDKLATISDLLSGVAQDNLTPEIFRDTKRAQQFLNERYTMKKMFEMGNGIFLFSADGKVVAETGSNPPRVGLDLSYRDYFKKTIQTRKSVISSVYASSQPHHHPSIMFTAPVFNKDGSIAGILGGSFDLMRPNFVGDLMKAHIGKSGYYFLLDTERTNIVHHDPKRIMKRDVPVGANKLFDKAMEGLDITGETINSKGIPMLASFRHLKKTNWIIGANLPLDEAYAPIKNVEYIFWVARILGILTILITIWFFMRRLLKPLLSLIEQVKNVTPSARVVIDTNDEIHDLADAFNQKLEIIDESSKILEKERETYRTLSDFASDWIFWRDTNGNVVYSSPAAVVVSGYSDLEIVSDKNLMDTMIHPDDLDSWKNHKHKADLGGNPIPIQFRIITKGGGVRWIDHVCRPIIDAEGNFLGSRGSNRDITELKEREKRLHEQAEMLEEEVAERQAAQEELAVKQQQLLALNQSLEERVNVAIDELHEKDQMVMQQNRLASLGEMIRNIAHQWCQPLNNLGLIIQNSYYDYLAGLMTNEKMKEAMDQELQIIKFMSTTINDFRNFYRIDKEKSDFKIVESIRNAVNLVSASLKENNIAIIVEPSAAELTVHGYPNEYAQVLLNIICNSRDVLLERNTENSCIMVSSKMLGNKTAVTIRDNAGGIDEEIIGKIFDPYFTTKEQGGGTGIGLYMSKIIIEKNMGGSLTVCNVDGGAEFVIAV